MIWHDVRAVEFVMFSSVHRIRAILKILGNANWLVKIMQSNVLSAALAGKFTSSLFDPHRNDDSG